MNRILENSILRRIIYTFIMLVMISQLMTSCLQFRMESSEVDNYFEQQEDIPALLVVEVEERTIHMAFQDNQKNTTVVFIHGAPGSWSAFIDFMKVDRLSDSMNIISVDRPGYGYSGFGDPVYSLELQSRYLVEAVKKVVDSDLIVVGHSLGGPVAARMMMDYPDDIVGGVLVAPSISPELEKREWYRYLGKLKIVENLIPASLWVTNEEIYDLKDELNLMLPLWETIESKVVVIQGTDDKLVPKGNADFAARVLPDSLLVINMLEGVNHFIPWSQPETITNAVLKLIRE
ncbi:MAG: alpha/beta hydrolase [Cyclobacteriaceae bacterium]